MRYRLMASYLGASYQAAVGPSDRDVTLFAAPPPPEEHGFSPAPGGIWRKQVRLDDLAGLWESRPIGSYHGEPCLVLDDLGDRLHIVYLGMDGRRGAQLGYWEVDRGVFEVVVPRLDVTDLAEERHEFPIALLLSALPRALAAGGGGQNAAGMGPGVTGGNAMPAAAGRAIGAIGPAGLAGPGPIAPGPAALGPLATAPGPGAVAAAAGSGAVADWSGYRGPAGVPPTHQQADAAQFGPGARIPAGPLPGGPQGLGGQQLPATQQPFPPQQVAQQHLAQQQFLPVPPLPSAVQANAAPPAAGSQPTAAPPAPNGQGQPLPPGPVSPAAPAPVAAAAWHGSPAPDGNWYYQPGPDPRQPGAPNGYPVNGFAQNGYAQPEQGGGAAPNGTAGMQYPQPFPVNGYQPAPSLPPGTGPQQPQPGQMAPPAPAAQAAAAIQPPPFAQPFAAPPVTPGAAEPNWPNGHGMAASLPLPPTGAPLTEVPAPQMPAPQMAAPQMAAPPAFDPLSAPVAVQPQVPPAAVQQTLVQQPLAPQPAQPRTPTQPVPAPPTLAPPQADGARPVAPQPPVAPTGQASVSSGLTAGGALSKLTGAVRGRRAARKPRLAMSAIFADLVDMADIPRSAYSVDEEVTGAMCLFKTDGGYEVFSCAEDARHEVRFFEEEEAAYFYLFGVLAAEALRNGRLSPRRG